MLDLKFGDDPKSKPWEKGKPSIHQIFKTIWRVSASIFNEYFPGRKTALMEFNLILKVKMQGMSFSRYFPKRFEWNLDFFHEQGSDRFKIVFLCDFSWLFCLKIMFLIHFSWYLELILLNHSKLKIHVIVKYHNHVHSHFLWFYANLSLFMNFNFWLNNNNFSNKNHSPIL